MKKLLTLVELPDEPTPAQIMQLDRESLEQLDSTRLRWQCQSEGCEGGTHVRDYGIAPWYFLDRNSKASWEQPDRYWNDLRKWFWMCSKHNKMYKRLIKIYDFEHVCARLSIVSLAGINNLITINSGPDGQPHP